MGTVGVGNKVASQLMIQNVGQTLARKVRVKSLIAVQNARIDATYLLKGINPEKQGVVLLPSETIKDTLVLENLDVRSAIWLLAKTSSIYILATVNYEDVFQREHQTIFCVELHAPFTADKPSSDACIGDLNSAN